MNIQNIKIELLKYNLNINNEWINSIVNHFNLFSKLYNL